MKTTRWILLALAAVAVAWLFATRTTPRSGELVAAGAPERRPAPVAEPVIDARQETPRAVRPKTPSPPQRRTGSPTPRPKKRSELHRRAREAREPSSWRPALLALSRLGTPEAHRALALTIQDPRNPKKASDAVGALARHPKLSAVAELQRLVERPSSRLTKLRAMQGLMLMLRWTPADEVDAEGVQALEKARTFLLTDGLEVTRAIARQSKLSVLRYEARQLESQITKFTE